MIYIHNFNKNIIIVQKDYLVNLVKFSFIEFNLKFKILLNIQNSKNIVIQK